jgi:tRNA(Ile)-lysidine synthetase-like protein
MADRIELQFRRVLEDLVPRGGFVVAAVSGGGDSVALLHLLARSAHSRRLRIAVAHLDHGLRRGSRADRRFVEGLSRELSIACVSDRREVDRLRRRDESPEEAARRVRRNFLMETARQIGADRVATGHTLDDQAETILMRLSRGAGATALTGMAASGPAPFVRPLLGFEGAELRGWLERRGLAFREDPTNRNLRFDRNRVRHLVRPVLTEQLNPRAARHLVKAAEILRDDALYLDALAEEHAKGLVSTDGRGRVSVDSAGLGSIPPVLARRVARLALLAGGTDARRVGSRHIAALLDLVAGPGRGEVHLPGRLRARRLGRRILVEPREP